MLHVIFWGEGGGRGRGREGGNRAFDSPVVAILYYVSLFYSLGHFFPLVSLISVAGSEVDLSTNMVNWTFPVMM